MSEEPEVSPLRLKRPGAGGPPSAQQQPAAVPPPSVPVPPPVSPVTPPVPAPSPMAEAPLMPLPGADTPPPSSPGQEVAGLERVRRRPSLAADNNSAAPAPAPAAEHVESPARPPDSAAAPAAAGGPPAGAPVFKLKVGAKPPPPPPPPLAETGPDAMAQALHALEHPPSEAPLLPLPGLAQGTLGGGMPALGGVPLPPLSPLPSPPPMAPPSVSAPGDAGAAAGQEAPSPHARAPIHLRAEASEAALDPAKLPPMPVRDARASLGRHHPRRDAVIFGSIFLLVAGAGAAAYFYFTKPEAAQEAIGDARKKLTQAAQLPGKAIDEARQSLAGARDKEQSRVDAVSEGRETPNDRAVGNVSPGAMEAKLREKNSAPPASSAPASGAATPPVQAVTAYAGEKASAEPAAAAESVQASARFQRYAEGIRVSGVFQGNPARALIDGRLVREGDMVEPTLGIRFADIDADAKQLILQDASGARVRVKY